MTITAAQFRHFLVLTVFLCFNAYADSQAMLATDKATIGLSQAIAALKAQGIKQIAFPTVVPTPAANAHYFVSTELKPNNVDYIVSFDNTEDCRGAHYCNVGSISSDIQGNPTIYFDNQDQEITQKIILDNGHSIYYTPGHAMGDFWPARVEWRCATTLYTLSWALDAEDERAALLKMVNSMWDAACS